jgi:hypothetical protein
MPENLFFMRFLVTGCHYWAKDSVESDEFIRENLVIRNGEERKKKQGKSKYRSGC